MFTYAHYRFESEIYNCYVHKKMNDSLFFHLLQNALNAQRVAGLIKTAETMGILDTSTESTKQSDIDEILGFLAALEKVKKINF